MGFDADVIVVGGGPGGGSAAYFLEQKGLRAVIVERDRLPRYKTCAGGVPGNALQLFPLSFSQVIEQRMEQGTFVYGGHRVTQPVPQDSLFMVQRGVFDAFLLRQSGAEVLEGEKAETVEEGRDGVTVSTRSGKRLRARYLIGADGPQSRVARCAGMAQTRDMGVGLEMEVDPGPEILDSYRGRFLVGLGALDNGYYWIFPKVDHLSVGIGRIVKGKRQLLSRLQQAMAGLGIKVQGHSSRAHPLPLYSPQILRQKGRILLVGDAAGLVDPLTGEGIRHAMVSGKLAAEALAQGELASYPQWVRHHIGKDLLWASRLARLFYSRQRECFEWLVRNRYVFQDMLRIVNCSMGYRTGLFKIPLYLLYCGQRVPLEE